MPFQIRTLEEDSTVIVYMPSRYKDETIKPSPWGVAGIHEHKLADA